ncbi:SDR family NAD(P)-dependent oxidoreductase [Chitinophaga sp. 212800010-3]|uniref:SDR family NAD(P)-dependent oxidoreductase n=1 Tax=unclassified Chitinophaga TaxID=2619133 RepID=UPI002DEC310E|nr:hypothetical protein [Chitinophaga sp. 212800010-3]
MKNSEKKLVCNDNMEIAIVGVACRFPGAGNYQEYWNNLVQGRSSISEIPPDRWRWEHYWGEQPASRKRSVSKWGGFIADIDAFDAGFFHISGREAQTMDPQQRIMMELAWTCFEDAGIPPYQLSGRSVGVFVGMSSMDYSDRQMLEHDLEVEAHHSTGSAAVLVPNRVSHFFNLRGPSFAVDTACSSALYAVHLAAQSILQGECKMALAGGINSLLNPIQYSYFSKTGMLSPTGSCKVFDESADGYVRGEGAGLVLLKPLKKALKHGDNIYGVIKGSAVNHNGNTHTISSPSSTAQAEVIQAAMQKAGITPDTISYVEAHGTGTPKGDPVEFASLTRAFNSYGQAGRPWPYCHIGSVKANIGHLEAAAGVASLVKVLMAMKHRQLPMQLNFKKLNPGINMNDSPFTLVNQLQEWAPLKDREGTPLPRRAAINAFGFGGTNAHLLVEEPPAIAQQPHETRPAALVCISAKTPAALRRKMQDLLNWLDKEGNTCTITDVGAALLTGREHFAVRFACVISSMQELKKILHQAMEENAEGTDNRKKDVPGSLQQLQSYREAVRMAKKNKDPQTFTEGLQILAGLYIDGYNTDWAELFNRKKIRRLNLPTYPFEQKKYWILRDTITPGPAIENKVVQTSHPLLHDDASTPSEPRYSSGFSGNEFFLSDHVINGRVILPGVAYLEMAREAIAGKVTNQNTDGNTIVLRNVVWARPFVAEKEKENGHLYTGINNNMGYYIYQQDESGRKTVYSEGTFRIQTALTAPVHDLVSLQASCNKSVFSGEQCYELFRQRGIHYGPTFQLLEKIYTGENKVMARLSALKEQSSDNNFLLHPALLDAATQAAIGLLASLEGKGHPVVPYVPFALNELLIYSPCTSATWSIVSYSNESVTDEKVRQLNIDVCNPDGSVCVQLKGLMLRAFEEEKPVAELGEEPLLLFEPVWKEAPALAHGGEAPGSNHLVVLCGLDHINPADISRAMEGAHCIPLMPAPGDIARQFNAYAQAIVESVQQQVHAQGGRISMQIVVNNYGEQSALSGFSGLMYVLHNEYPDAAGQLLSVAAGETALSLAVKLKESAGMSFQRHIRYVNGTRQVPEWEEWKNTPLGISRPWQTNGVYLITGGGGGLGLLFAEEIARRCKRARIILTGRSSPDARQEDRFQHLRQLGAEITYRQADVSRNAEVATLFEDIRKNYGQLNGIIHAAGVLRDNFIVKKTNADIHDVLAAKTNGIVNLDQAWGRQPLDFFLSFSSVAGVWGTAGQSDYAMGNAFVDAYTHYRNELVAAGERKGKTISINWPYWQEGGMKLSSAIIDQYRENTGMAPLTTTAGISAFYGIMSAGVSQVMVVQGDVVKIRKLLSPPAPKNTAPVPPPSRNKMPAADLGTLLKEKVAALLQVDIQEIDEDTPLIEYGFDSILFTEFARKLGDTFGVELSPAVFFSYQTLKALAEYLVTDKGISGSKSPEAPPVSINRDVAFPELIQLNKGTRERPVFWLHSGMGSVVMYNKLAQLTERPFFGIQPRGWAGSHDPLKGVVEMADYYTRIITSVQLEGPYDLGGYSLGGTLAYEITRQLQAAGKSVNSVVMIDTITGPLLKEFMVNGNHALLIQMNLLLHSTIHYSASGMTGLLIRNDEVDFETTESAFIEQLIALSRKRGMESLLTELPAMLHRHTKVHLAFEPDKYAPGLLPDPAGFDCYYFGNRNNHLYGDMEPYYRPVTGNSQSALHYSHDEWKRHIPQLKFIEVDGSNHFTMMSEQRALNGILPVCERLYA